MVSKCVNKTLFLYRDGVRLHRMKFYIYECTERNDLKSMIQERCGIVVQTKGEHVVCFAPQYLDLEDGEIFSTEYIKQCCESNMLLDLKNFRLGKNPVFSNVDPLEVLKGIASWPQNIRCFRNSGPKDSINELKNTKDFELSSLKRKRSTIKKNGMEQERRVCHWRQAYSREEDEQIITYLLKNNNYKKAGTNTLWKKMELQEVLKDRSWQSMKNRLRIIRLHIERYDLCDEDIKKLGGKPAAVTSNSLKVSVESSRCCFCCPKMNYCDIANGNDYVRYSCPCSQSMKRQAVTTAENEALVQLQSNGCTQSQAKPNQESCVRKEKPLGVDQFNKNRAETVSYSNSALNGDETKSESDPEYSFKNISSPFHKINKQVRAINGSQPEHKRKLYVLPSSDINISIKSVDISLLKKSSAQKKNSIPLRWPQIFTPINSALFGKEVIENDSVAPEALNHKPQNQNRCHGDNDSSVYGSCQPHGTENGSESNSSRSMPSGEANKATTAVDNPTIVKLTCLSSKPNDTLPNKGQNTLDMISHSTPKKLFQIFNKRGSKRSVNESTNISGIKQKLMKNRMEIEDGIVSPSFSTSDTISGFGLQKREERSPNQVNECLNGQMSCENSKLQTSKSSETQHESQFEITDMLYSDRLQNEVSPITQHTAAGDIRPVPEKDISSSPTHYQEHSNSKQQSSTGNSIVYEKKHCQHIFNYKDFYVKQWLSSVMNYYKNCNLSKLPSFSEQLKEASTSSVQDSTSSVQHDHGSKNISCDHLNEETSHHTTDTSKSYYVQKEVSKTDEQGITESYHEAEDSNDIVNNERVPSDSSKISTLKDTSVSVNRLTERFDCNELSQTSSHEDSRKRKNLTETPDRNVLRKIISEPSNKTSTANSKSDNECHLQSYTKRNAPVNNENHRDEPCLQLSHVVSICNKEHSFEESCDIGDIILDSQPSQISNHIPIHLKQEKGISIADEDNLLDDEDSILESQLPQDSMYIKQEISISLENEEFGYEGYSPPVDFLTHMPDSD